MCQNAEELKKMANWTGVKGGSRENLMDNICGKNFVYHSNTWNTLCGCMKFLFLFGHYRLFSTQHYVASKEVE